MRRSLTSIFAVVFTLSVRAATAAPESRITSPSNGAVVSGSLVFIGGTAAETAPIVFKRKLKKKGVTRNRTVGVSFVQVEVQAPDGTWWNGAAWTKKEKWIVAQGQANWQLNSSRIRWQAGKTYVIRSRAVNARKKVEKPVQVATFSVGGTP